MNAEATKPVIDGAIRDVRRAKHRPDQLVIEDDDGGLHVALVTEAQLE